MSKSQFVFDKPYLQKQAFLSLVRQHKVISRSAVSAITATRPSTITDLSKELLEAGILREAEDLAANLGQTVSRRDLMLNPEYCRIIGLDIQTDCIIAVLIDFVGTVLQKISVPINEDYQQPQILQLLYDCVDALRQAAQPHHILGVGVSSIGILDRKTNTILMTFARTNWSHVEPAQLLAARYPDLSFFVEDQVVCKLYAEKEFLDGAAERNSVFMDTGNVLGCSMYFNGSMLCNRRGISGEIGHFSVGSDNEICSCGNTDCLFTVASVGIIVRKVRRTLENGTISVLNDLVGDDLSQLNIDMILDAAQQGDRIATNVLTTAALHVGQAISYIINLMGPDEVILGGNMVSGSDFFLNIVMEEAKKKSLCLISDYITFRKESFPVVGGALGATCMVLNDFFKNGYLLV